MSPDFRSPCGNTQMLTIPAVSTFWPQMLFSFFEFYRNFLFKYLPPVAYAVQADISVAQFSDSVWFVC